MTLSIIKSFLGSFTKKLKNIVFLSYRSGGADWFTEDKHQLKCSTSYDRYPEIFSVVSEYFDLKNVSNIKILSFGCSTGEECFTLRKYFPDAKIIGVDINRNNIHICEKRNKDKKISFIYSNGKNIDKEAPFDIIFCMSVLCRWPESRDLENISKIYPFSKYEKTIRQLDSFLVKGGALVISNSNFLFKDSSLYFRYKILEDPRTTDDFVQKFSKTNKRLSQVNSDGAIFFKE